LPPRLPDARRPALPGPEPRAVAAPARLDLLLRPRPDRRQLRRGARARHERARVDVDLVGPPVERRARAHAARRARPDAPDRRARQRRRRARRVPARVRGLGGARQGVRGAGGSGSLPPARRRRGGEARGPQGSRRGRAHPAVAARALAGLKAHERLSIGHYMLRRWSLEEDVRHLERLGFRSISLASTKLGAYGVERAIRLVRASALKVAHVGSYGWFGTERRTIRKGIEQVRRAIEWVHRLDGDALFVISGGRNGASWEAAARAYRDAYARLLPEATAAGIRLAIEVIHPLRQDLSFINTLADAREIARAAGRRGGYVLDFFHSGWERRLLETVRAADQLIRRAGESRKGMAPIYGAGLACRSASRMRATRWSSCSSSSTSGTASPRVRRFESSSMRALNAESRRAPNMLLLLLRP